MKFCLILISEVPVKLFLCFCNFEKLIEVEDVPNLHYRNLYKQYLLLYYTHFVPFPIFTSNSMDITSNWNFLNIKLYHNEKQRSEKDEHLKQKYTSTIDLETSKVVNNILVKIILFLYILYNLINYCTSCLKLFLNLL